MQILLSGNNVEDHHGNGASVCELVGVNGIGRVGDVGGGMYKSYVGMSFVYGLWGELSNRHRA